MSALKESGVEHHECKVFHHMASKCWKVLTSVRGEVSDEDELGARGFCIGEDLDTRLVVAWDIESGPFGGRCDGGAPLVSLAFGRRSEVLLTLASISSISKSPTATTAIKSGLYQRW